MLERQLGGTGVVIELRTVALLVYTDWNQQPSWRTLGILETVTAAGGTCKVGRFWEILQSESRAVEDFNIEGKQFP